MQPGQATMRLLIEAVPEIVRRSGRANVEALSRDIGCHRHYLCRAKAGAYGHTGARMAPVLAELALYWGVLDRLDLRAALLLDQCAEELDGRA